VNGGGIAKNRKDSTIIVLGLEPYINYFVELNANSFEYIAWRIKKKTLNMAINPNQLKLVEIPISVVGEALGMVYIQKENEQKGIGRIKVCFYNKDSLLVASTLTEIDGFFSFLGLAPGSYTARIDTAQLRKLHMFASPATLPFDISRTEEGDFVEGINFVLQSNPINKSKMFVPAEK
jgi:hypothetical protein